MALTPPQDDDRFYKGDTLTRAFAISSIVMLIFTVWMVLDDFGREWKGYQRQFREIKKAKYDKLIETAKGSVDEAKLKELQAALAAAEKSLESQKKEIETREAALTKAKTKEGRAIANFQDEKANWDVKKYEYEAVYGHMEAHEVVGHHGESHAAAKTEGAPADGHGAEATPEGTPVPVATPVADAHPKAEKSPKAQAAYKKLVDDWQKVLVAKDKSGAATQEKDARQAEYNALFAEKEKTTKEIKIARAELDRLESARTATLLSVKDMIRSSPVIDLADPAFKLQQIVLPTIRDDIFFAQVQKVDRCTTCHQAIDTPGFEDQPHPFRTHPRLDVMLGSRSPHPIDKIGCTVCHEGRGQATHFTRTAHTPKNHEQEKEWKRNYGWHEMHHVIEKMVPLQYTEGKCRVCHRGTEYVPKAEKLNASLQLIKSAGCYGCHRIEGWDHIRKPAPSLKRIKGKLTRDWIVKWVRDPKSFNAHTRMPSAFHQSNITTEEFHQFNEAEIQGIADYLMQSSEVYRPNYAVGNGDAERGKQLFGTVGCLGCHQVEDFPRTGSRFGQAPDLSTVGSKVSKEWLNSWLKNPRHYFEQTTMPSFRLTDGEIADLSAYLLSKKNPTFEQAAAGERDTETQKKVMRLYLLRDPRMAPVTEQKVADHIAKLSPDELSVTLGQSAVGRYGCFGCHEVKGYETTQGIGTELTEWGSKPVNKLDFGLLPLERTNYHWADQKLKDTRSYDTGVVKEYLDLLRMPQYGFNEKEREQFILALLGQTAQKIAPPAAKALTARETAMEEGMRVIHKYNCQGCHVVEQLHQPLPEGHPGFDDHEKNRHATEGRILSYYEEDETMGPPPLVTQGSRVKTLWAHSFIKDPSHKLRRGLKVRMPSFQMSSEELNKLVSYWAAYGNIDFPVDEQKPVQLAGQQLSDARTLFNNLQCTNCHTVGQATLSQADLEGGSKGAAPDLSRSYGRLNKKWIVELLKDPQKMIPGTRMPGFWAEGVSPFPNIAGGNSQTQMELVADYVLMLGQGRAASQSSPSTSSAPATHKVASAKPKKLSE